MIASMPLSLDSRARLNDGVEIPYLGLGVYESPTAKATRHSFRYALEIPDSDKDYQTAARAK